MASPPRYTASGSIDAYPQPTTRPGSVRQRKSSTLIPIAQPAESSASPEISPARSTALLPDYGTYEPTYAEDAYHSVPRKTPPHANTNANALPAHLRDVARRNSSSSSASAAEEGEATPLLGDERPKVLVNWYKGPLFVAGVKFSILFVAFTAILAGTFYFGLPEMEEADKALVKLPRSFADLQALNGLFQKYKREYPLRLLACGVVSYLFVQMFSLPGSMYISILFGAAYGIVAGLVLSCLCDAFGGSLCYLLSAVVAPPLLELPFYRARVETWRIKIMGDPKKGKQVSWGDVFAFLVVLRISPVPPHWVANFLAPHLGIGIPLFWLSCFVGIAPISVIHVTIGSSLDTMTSAADFHLVSVRNILGLVAVIVAVLIPVGLKRVFKKDIGDLDEAEHAISESAVDDAIIDVPAVEGQQRRYQAVDSGVILAGPSRGDDSLDTGNTRKGKGRALAIIADVEDEDEEGEEEEELFVTEEPVATVKHEKRPIGYGTIEPVQREVNVGGGPWWSR